MFARRLAPGTIIIALLLGGLPVLACSDEDSSTGPAPGAALVGTWDATSFATDFEDFIAQGMTLQITLNADKTYEIEFTNDLVGACNPGPDCINTGDYGATVSTLTIDPGTADQTVFIYNIKGTELTLTGQIGGIDVTIVLDRVT